jgi:hypothetical protein
MIIPFVNEAPPRVSRAKVTELLAKMHSKVLIGGKTDARVQAEERSEIGVHVVFVIADAFFIEVIHRGKPDGGNEVHKILQPQLLW